MKIEWVRGNDKIKFNVPQVFFVNGIRGSGKSSFLEYIAEQYLSEGHNVLDLFGSRDGENLAWLRSPWAKEKSILLLHGEGVDVTCNWNVKPVDAVTLHDIEKNDIVISASPLYADLSQEYIAAAKITDMIWKRLSWHKIIYCIVREAANLYYSRLKVREDQTQAKAEMVYLLRESRHMGLALGLDSLRWHSIDIDVRSLADYLIFKNMGQIGLSREMRFLYSYVDPYLFMHLAPQEFIIVSRKGSIGAGVFPYPGWHKTERENLLNMFDIKVEYTETPKGAIDKGKFKTVSDEEHAQIIKMYVEEKKSMMTIAKELKRSPTTINQHIDAHNNNVEKLGYCGPCKRVKSAYASYIARRVFDDSIYTLQNIPPH
ncbi:MAG: hypothetical protein QXL54_03155 [Candidatus Bathyarchaeia archaeon]